MHDAGRLRWRGAFRHVAPAAGRSADAFSLGRAQFELTVVQSHDCGDHLLLVCDVGDATPAMLACEALTTGELRARGII